MIGTVFHYAVVEPEDDHAHCEAQAQSIIAMHERMGYRTGGAYNGHFCIHGGSWLSYTGPNQASGNTWANLNLEAWCYLATVGTPVTAEAQQTAYELTLRNPRDRIHPHSDFFPTSCCGDPLRAWIAAGALPPAAPTPPVLYTQEPPVFYLTDGRRNAVVTEYSFFQVGPFKGVGYVEVDAATFDEIARQTNEKRKTLG